jgi:hypothetical protein
MHRIAGKGGLNPDWVEGEQLDALLVFDIHNCHKKHHNVLLVVVL